MGIILSNDFPMIFRFSNDFHDFPLISSRIFASHGAFAAVRCDGKCITWGGEDYGGDSSAVQERMLTVSIAKQASFD